MELRPRNRRIRGPAGRRRDHGDHVLRPRVLDRRDVARPPSHGRGLLVRAIGDGSLGRIPHRPRGEHGVRDHACGGGGRDGPADAADRGRSLRGRRQFRRRRIDRRHRLVEQPPVLVGPLLRDLRGDQHHRHRSHDEVHRRDHGPLSRCPGVLLHRRPRVREVRPELLDEPSEGRRRRRRLPRGWRRAVVPVRDRRHLQGPPVRDLVLPRDRRGSLGRGGVDGSAAGRPPRFGARDAYARDRGRADAVHQHGPARRRFALRCVRFPAPRRLQGDLLGREGRVRPGHPLHDRPDRELLHDHLRVRAKHVLAVTGGVLPFVPLDHPWRAEDSPRGADRRSGRRLRRGGARVHPPGSRTGCADRGGAAQHGGLRGRDLVHLADGVVRAPTAEPAEHRAAVRQQVGGPRGGRRWFARRDSPDRDLPERGLSTGGVRRRDLLHPRRHLFRDLGPEPIGALARGGVRAHTGRARGSAGYVRNERRCAGGHPPWRNWETTRRRRSRQPRRHPPPGSREDAVREGRWATGPPPLLISGEGTCTSRA